MDSCLQPVALAFLCVAGDLWQVLGLDGHPPQLSLVDQTRASTKAKGCPVVRIDFSRLGENLQGLDGHLSSGS